MLKQALKQWLKKAVWRGEGWERSRQQDSVSLDCGQTALRESQSQSICGMNRYTPSECRGDKRGEQTLHLHPNDQQQSHSFNW